jgi:hypothetical protein
MVTPNDSSGPALRSHLAALIAILDAVGPHLPADVQEDARNHSEQLNATLQQPRLDHDKAKKHLISLRAVLEQATAGVAVDALEAAVAAALELL